MEGPLPKGSIPVGTGNPGYHAVWGAEGKVYPRGHGESSRPFSAGSRGRGLSPWARGIRLPPGTRMRSSRSIPVGTGNPAAWMGSRREQGVYPRGHGESVLAPGQGSGRPGLSPWARGIRRSGSGLVRRNGSIPVGTGNPAPEDDWPNDERVYPRGHGESPRRPGRTLWVRGLSPWARGIRQHVRAAAPRLGSIPVGTGNPATCSGIRCRPWVYPRGHGESLSPESPLATAAGLSPWARGIPLRSTTVPGCTRSIPVGTGNPQQGHH